MFDKPRAWYVFLSNSSTGLVRFSLTHVRYAYTLVRFSLPPVYDQTQVRFSLPLMYVHLAPGTFSSPTHLRTWYVSLSLTYDKHSPWYVFISHSCTISLALGTFSFPIIVQPWYVFLQLMYDQPSLWYVFPSHSYTTSPALGTFFLPLMYV